MVCNVNNTIGISIIKFGTDAKRNRKKMLHKINRKIHLLVTGEKMSPKVLILPCGLCDLDL